MTDVKSRSRHRILQPTSTLHELVDRPGGTARGKAIAEASRRVEEQREPALKAIEELIFRIEDVTSGKPGKVLPLDEICRIADQIVGHSTTYGLHTLARAGKNLCDLINIFKKLGQSPREPLLVHVRALRLCASRTAISDAMSESVLAELKKVRMHVSAKADINAG